jgi:hypothetical protein
MFSWKMDGREPQGLILQQSNGDENVTEVPKSVKYVVSGSMAGCCTVAVLWDWQTGDLFYRYMRAQHGAGGPEAIGWNALMKDVPVNGNTLVIGACEPDDKESYQGKLLRVLRHFRYAYAPSFYACTNVLIWRHGLVENANWGAKKSEEAEAEVKLLEKRPKYAELKNPNCSDVFLEANWLDD